jgi:DoxX-like protein
MNAETIARKILVLGASSLIGRFTCTIGLIWGIVASLGYMVGAAILTPDLWTEPLGALVKTGPAIVLMLVALLMLDNR